MPENVPTWMSVGSERGGGRAVKTSTDPHKTGLYIRQTLNVIPAPVCTQMECAGVADFYRG